VRSKKDSVNLSNVVNR